MVVLRAVSHGSAHRNCRNNHIRLLRFVPGPNRSSRAVDDRSSTSTSTVLLCMRWPPCPPGPVSLRRLVPDCKLRLPAPGPPGLHGARAICLDTILLFSYPFLRTSPPP